MACSLMFCLLVIFGSFRFTLPNDEINYLNTATAQFGIDLLNAKPSENIFCSPASISFCLGMLHAGAEGETKLQLSRALYSDLTDHEIYEGLKNLSNILHDHSMLYELSIANRIYIQNSFNILQDYKTMLQMYFGSEILSVDFTNSAESVRKDINSWVEDQTNHKIVDMLPEHSLDHAVLALISAMYFKGNWLNKFNESITMKKPFHTSENEVVNVDMMKQNHQNLFYSENVDMRMLGLPYDGEQLTMYIILPTVRYGLKPVEQVLTGDDLLSMVRTSKKIKVDEVQIPKMKLEKQLDLTNILKTFNVSDMFIPGKADLSGINGKRDLFVSSVFHNAFLEVNENGTEAAASTTIVVPIRSIAEQPTVTFIADQPFLFAIIEQNTLNVLFLGRYLKPEN